MKQDFLNKFMGDGDVTAKRRKTRTSYTEDPLNVPFKTIIFLRLKLQITNYRFDLAQKSNTESILSPSRVIGCGVWYAVTHIWCRAHAG